MAEAGTDGVGGSSEEPAPARRHRLARLGAIAALIVIADQATKVWVDASFALASRSVPSGDPGGPTPVLGELVRIAKTYNDGAIFGLLGAAAPALAAVTLVVIGAILWYAWRHGERLGPVVNLGLALLLGGAIGNLVDRVRLGHVVDFVDAGIGSLRWYAFNVADAAVSVDILLLVVAALLGERVTSRRADGHGPADPPPRVTADGPATPPSRPT